MGENETAIDLLAGIHVTGLRPCSGGLPITFDDPWLTPVDVDELQELIDDGWVEADLEHGSVRLTKAGERALWSNPEALGLALSVHKSARGGHHPLPAT